VPPSSICPARSHHAMSAPAAASAGPRPFAERPGGDAQHDARTGPAAGRQVSGLVRPCPESARPESRAVHHPGDRFFPSGAAQQFHPPLDQDPPEVGGIALTEEHVAAFEAHLVTGRDQVAELPVAQPLEQEDTTQVIDEHQPNLPGAVGASGTGAAPAIQERTIAPGETTQPSPTVSIAGFATPAPSLGPCPVEAIRVAAGQCSGKGVSLRCRRTRWLWPGRRRTGCAGSREDRASAAG